MKTTLATALCLVLSLCLILSLSFVPESHEVSWLKTSGHREAQDPALQDLEEVAEFMDKSWFPLMADLLESYPRENFDVSHRAALLRRDADSVFEWVRDHTFLVPYQGQLRGARGVLMDRRGNSLDRALLLEELLREKGFAARLVRGILDDGVAARLLDESPLFPEEGLDEPPAQFDELEWLKISNRYGLTDDAAETNIKAQSAMEDLVARVAETSAALEELNLRPVASSERTRAVTDLTDHWWVQYRQDQGWIDLDPSLPDARSGERLAEPREEAVGPSLVQSVRVKMIVERWEKDGGLVEEVALDQRVSPFEYTGKAFTLSHIAPDWPGLLEDSAELPNQPEQLEQTVGSQDAWIPTISVGKLSTIGQEIDELGRLSDPELDPRVRQANKLRETLEGPLDILSRRLAGETEQPGTQPNENDPVWTAQWLEFEIAVPGRELRRVRRTVFDLLGEARRAKPLTARPGFTDEQRVERALALQGQVRFVLLCSDISPDFGTVEVLSNTLDRRERLMRLLKSDSADPTELVGILSGDDPFPGALMGLASLRRLFGPQSLSYIDSPGILATFDEFDREAGQLYMRHGIDFVAGGIGVHPRAGAESAALRFQQGVLDTWAETYFLDKSVEVENTAVFFARRDALGSEWRTIKSKSDPAWNEIVLDDDERARLETVLERGFWLVLPGERIPLEERRVLTWWQFDPSTGDILGMGGRGRGLGSSRMGPVSQGTFVEWLATHQKKVSAAAAFITFWGAFFGCAGAPEMIGGSGVDDAKIVGCVACAALAAAISYWTTSSWLGQVRAARAFTVLAPNLGQRQVIKALLAAAKKARQAQAAASTAGLWPWLGGLGSTVSCAVAGAWFE